MSSSDRPVIVWFRQDLRLRDNPALNAAAATERPVVALYILDDETPGNWRCGGASRWWLHHSLTALGDQLSRLGNRLILRRGSSQMVLKQMVQSTGATQVFWNRCYEPWSTALEPKLAELLSTEYAVACRRFSASLLFDPDKLRNKSGHPFRVFTPFWKHCLQQAQPRPPLGAPSALPAYGRELASDLLADYELLPSKPDWAGGLRESWRPGEEGAWRQLENFCATAITDYREERDRPARPKTSRLSPHLHFGEISPRSVWHAVRGHHQSRSAGAGAFLREVGWREFCHHLLHHFPQLPSHPFRPEFVRFPWKDDPAAFRAWSRGKTGYPIVDAGMRQLWRTGWMHNRVRMVAASFLVKHLLIPWQRGQAWFWDTLVDADLANNAAGWQWVAGCGADAAPYFRIFNPTLQGERFDPQGEYVRQWVPELCDLPSKWIHKPWMAPPAALAAAGVTLGVNYPRPMVDHAQSRALALQAFATLK